MNEMIGGDSFERLRFIMEPKICPTYDRAVIGRQVYLYAQGLFQGYRYVQPMPAGDECPSEGDWGDLPGDPACIIRSEVIAEAAVMKHYAEADETFTMSWWRQYRTPVLANKITRQEYQSYNELIRPETLVAMARPYRVRS